jgi:hypothetical protein
LYEDICFAHELQKARLILLFSDIQIDSAFSGVKGQLEDLSEIRVVSRQGRNSTHIQVGELAAVDTDDIRAK